MMSVHLFFFTALATVLSVSADEGMWPYNDLPIDDLRSRYGFEPESGFFEKLQSSSVRLNNGGSGSFVSPFGLVMTNHHVASGCIQQLSSEKKDYIQDGFYASRRSAERKCLKLELNVLKRIATVTDQVNRHVYPEMNDIQRQSTQKTAIAKITKDCRDSTLNRCDVVSLHSGNVFDLYEYKRYTDVRLVFAPEYRVAFFGGNKDNFSYPRYCFDVAFLRVYEKGRPIESPSFLAWGKGVENTELVFVSGHPGKTNRLLTLSQLVFERDRRIPFVLDWLNNTAEALRNFGRGGGDAKRLARDELFRVNNAIKNYTGQLRGLRSGELLRNKKDAEMQLISTAKSHDASWKAITNTQRAKAEIYEEHQLLGSFGFHSHLFSIARHLYRLQSELLKLNEERLPEYRDSALESLYQEIYSSAPIYTNIETVKLAASMRFMRDRLGFDHPVIAATLQNKNPELVAKRLVTTTKLREITARKLLAAASNFSETVSQDPLLEFVAEIDPYSRKLRKRYEDEVEAVENTHGAQIAKVRFAVGSKGIYPDATFTLRLSFGIVAGYQELGVRYPPFTTMNGLFEKAGDQAPYRLPKRFEMRKRNLTLETPYNLVSTNDITGGNSGSPLINKKGEIVGIVFDGNIHQLANNFQYRDTRARAISVDSRGILETLGKVYRAQRLVNELERTNP